jgi:uncharacterized membrane protein YphA (DoxX/SURF4 family)
LNGFTQINQIKTNIMDINMQNATTARQVLKYTYGLVPIVAGLDKFVNLLTDWKAYLSDSILDILPFSAGTFMAIVGVVEIVAGILVLFRTVLGAYIVMGWLTLIALTLIAEGHYFDVAVRDLVMAIGAFALAKLSSARSPEWFNDR